MNDLFVIGESYPPPQPRHNGTGNTCGKCGNAVRPHHYRPDWIYCAVTKDNRSQFGIKRVRSRQDACPRFVEESK